MDDRKHIHSYFYTNAEGAVIYEKMRFEPKTFRARHTNESGQVVWGINGIEQQLYLRHTLNDIRGKKVVIVEGEKDADFVSERYGMLVTSPPNGSGSWKSDYAKVFAGADVIICPDNDKAGEKMAAQAYEDIEPFCNTVRIVKLPYGKDISEWAGTPDEFNEIIEQAKPTPDHTAIGDITFSNAAKLANDASPPTYLINKILEIDSHGILAGASQAFKSFMALEMAHCLANGVDFMGYKTFHQHKVIYICGEGLRALSRRLRALNIVKGVSADNLLVLDQKIFLDNDLDIERISLEIQRIRPALVIMDTLSSMNSKTNENDNSEVSSVLSKIQRAIANGFTSSLIVHHFGKDAERGVRGASAFTANSDFVMLMEREADKGMACRLSSFKTKDGDNFEDIHVVARPVDIGLMNQDGTGSTSLVLDLAEHSLDRFKSPKMSKSSELNSIFLDAFYSCMDDDPVVFNDKIGVKRKYFCTVAKNMVGKSSEYVRVCLSKYINSGIFEEIPLKVNNILILK